MCGCSKTIIHLEAHCPGNNLHVWLFQNHHSFGCPLPRLQPSCLAVPKPSFIWMPIAQVTTFMFGCFKTIIHLEAHCPGYNLHVWMFQNHHSFGSPLPRLQPSCLAVPKPSFIWKPIAQVTTFMFGCSKTIIHLDVHSQVIMFSCSSTHIYETEIWDEDSGQPWDDRTLCRKPAWYGGKAKVLSLNS